MKKAAFLFFRVEVGNAACAVQYLVVVQTMLVRCPKNLDFTVFQKVSLSNLIFRKTGVHGNYGVGGKGPYRRPDRQGRGCNNRTKNIKAQKVLKIRRF